VAVFSYVECGFDEAESRLQWKYRDRRDAVVEEAVGETVSGYWENDIRLLKKQSQPIEEMVSA
jgi:hypothetical protein